MQELTKESVARLKVIKNKIEKTCLFYGNALFQDIKFIGEDYPILYLAAPSYIASKKSRGFMATEIQEVEKLILKELRCLKIKALYVGATTD